MSDERYYQFCPSCTTRLRRKLLDGQKRLSCPQCSFVFWNNPKPVVSILVTKQGRILLLQRAQRPLKGFWCLPGGFININETPKQAAMREVREEAGGKVTITSLIGIYRINNDPRGIHLDIIYAGLLKGSITLSDEHVAFRFFPPERLPRKIAYKHREAIRDWRMHRSRQRSNGHPASSDSR